MDPDGSNFRNFRDFHVHRGKVMRALHWLKANNKFYRDIDIDDEILQTLPENGSFAEKLPQFTDDRTNSSEEESDERTRMMKTHSIPKYLFLHYPPDLNEDRAINEILNGRNMIMRELTGRITKFLRLMSFIPLDI
ncbi:hypothetical protein C1646_674788 [Rhizophagus diaphanus]|nr:hypothetical protein C1646_674788 [Rhizophagus diaphanus] [Rhizophagus sp. MUCL 43196]